LKTKNHIKKLLDVSFIFFTFRDNIVILLYNQRAERPKSLGTLILFLFLWEYLSYFTVHLKYKKNIFSPINMIMTYEFYRKNRFAAFAPNSMLNDFV